MIVYFIAYLLAILIVCTIITFIFFIYFPTAHKFADGSDPSTHSDVELLNISLNYVSGLISTAGGGYVVSVSSSAIAWSTFLHMIPYFCIPILIYVCLCKHHKVKWI